MGKRDKRWRETKKPKRGAKRITTVFTSPVAVEVIKKGKRTTEEEQ